MDAISERYDIFRGTNFPNMYLVVSGVLLPEKAVPFNLLHHFGDLELHKGHAPLGELPFAEGSRRKIAGFVDEWGYCFYKWPGKILGPSLGDVLEID